jgi:putative heme-binding domain-containing protein
MNTYKNRERFFRFVRATAVFMAFATAAAAHAQDAEVNPRLDATIETQPGFEVELLYRPNLETEGSWVALCAGPGGVLYAADQYGKLYELTPPPVDNFATPLGVRALGVEIEGAQGLCYAFDSLYVMATGRGLMRVTDSDGDGVPDAPELIVAVDGAGEHGPHGVVVAPDGKSLLFTAGNHTPLPALDFSRVPEVWAEDQLLPRDSDPRGHAVGVMAPGGYICRVSPDGSEVELICAGFRNTYDLAVSPAGDVLAYDSDMEWDLGLPWYRPTRLCLAASGVDFGWRNGSGKFSPVFEDSSPPVVEIGPGSPTGVVFGTGAAFPADYQQSLFMLDWTFGVMYAVTLEPDGASYSAQVEKFLSGKPLPLTDAAIGADGALYFTTGGRRLQGGLYRVVYRGDEDTNAVHDRLKPTHAKALRLAMESLHREDPPAGAIATIWNQLDHEDRFVRQAARIALEHQPVDRWRGRALAESNADMAVIALLALTRHADDSDRGAIIKALSAIETEGFDQARQNAWIRAWTLVFTRLGRPTDTERAWTLAVLSPIFPSGKDDLDRQLVELLVYLHAPGVIERTLERMDAMTNGTPPSWSDLARRSDQYGPAITSMLDNPPPTAQLHYARALSFADEGWTLAQRQRYLSLLNLASSAGGGMSYLGYIDRMRERHLGSCTEQERTLLKPLTERPEAGVDLPTAMPTGPGRAWTTLQADEVIAALDGEPNLVRGAGLFRTLSCVNCHQIGGRGANAGPDLSSAGNTFSRIDLLRAIIEPSAAITDQYAMSAVLLTDGMIRRGVVVDSDDERVQLAIDFLDLERTIDIPQNTVTSITPSPISPMPPGLVNALNPKELRDLVAFVLSGGQTGED